MKNLFSIFKCRCKKNPKTSVYLRICKGKLIHFKTGDNIACEVEKGDILQGIFFKPDIELEVFANAQYLGGGIDNPLNYKFLTSITI